MTRFNIRVFTVILAVVLMYLLFDPGTNSWFPRCPFKALTGYDCALCGTQRAFHSILCGKWYTALHQNMLATLLLPVILLSFIPWRGQSLLRLLYNKTGSTFVITMVSFLIIGWSILRNLIQL